MDTKFKNPQWPVDRKIYPVKPVYIAKVVSYIIFLAGAFLVVGLTALFLLPVVFWLIPAIMSGHMVNYMASQMLPETHLTLLAGLTMIFFLKAVLVKEQDTPSYFKWLILCAVFASFTTAAKINAAYIALLPLSLMWRLYKENGLAWKRAGMIAAALSVPYVLVNPALIFNFNAYKTWLLEMRELSGTAPGIWAERVKPIAQVLKDLHLYNVFPAALLILLFILACVVMIKKNPAAFGGFMFFFLFSFSIIANMKHAFYGRHLMFLILPFNLFILFPLMEYFQRMPKRARAFVTLVCLIVTLWVYPPHKVVQRIGALKEKSFTAKWKQESRDKLAEFVKNNDAVIYFYDFHGFSLPDTIYDRIIPFKDIDEIPERLKPGEYVAFIRYKKADKGVFNPIKKYNGDVLQLLENYEIIKTLGKPGGVHDINDQSPLSNPTIELMKPKNQEAHDATTE
jgi:hypothetical protein